MRPKKQDKVSDGQRPTLADSLAKAQLLLANTDGKLRATADIAEFNKSLIYTGLIEVDLILKLGFGSRLQLLGDPSAGKTLLSYMLIAAVQKTCRKCTTPIIPFTNDRTGEVITTCRCGKNDGMTAVYIDMEGEFDPAWASAWGVQLGSEDLENYNEITPGVKVSPNSKFVVIRLENLDQLTVVATQLVSEGAADFVVCDSLAALMSRESSQGKDQPGTRARAISKLMAGITSGLAKCWINYGSCPTMVYPNQYRMKIGGSPMADPRTAAGGLSPAYMSVQSLHLSTNYADETGGFKGIKAYGETTAKIKKDKFSGDVGAEARYRVYLKPMSVSRVDYQPGDTDEGAKLWSYVKEIGESLGDTRWFYKDNKGYHVLGRTFSTAKEIQLFLSRPDIGYMLRFPIFALKFSPQMRQHLKADNYNYCPFKDEPILELINEASKQVGRFTQSNAQSNSALQEATTRALDEDAGEEIDINSLISSDEPEPVEEE